MISIIITVFNIENYLRRCLNSILGQSITDYEVIMVDDGSTDDSGDICEEFTTKDSRFKVIHKKNEGVAKARITGLEASSGQYISFIDGDDFIDPNYLYKLEEALIAGNYDMVSCQYVIYYNEDKILKNGNHIQGPLYRQDIQQLITTKLLYDKDNGKSGFPFYLPTKLIKREYVVASIYNGIGIKYVEDMPMSFSILNNIDSMCVLPAFLYFYVQHSGQETKSLNPDLWENYIKCWRKLISLDKDHLLESQLPDRIWFRLSSVIDDILSKEHTYKGFTRRFKEIHEAKDIMHYLYKKKTNNKLKKQMLMIIKYKLYGLYYFYHKLKNPSKAQA